MEKPPAKKPKSVVVLNLLFKPNPYATKDRTNIENWIKFFQDQNMLVIATPPKEREEVFEMLNNINPDLLIKFPVQSFDTCDRWRAGFSEAISLMLGHENKYFYLWSADFDYDDSSKAAAEQLLSYSGTEDLVVGTIQAKQMKNAIDEYGTIPLIECWFPEESDRMGKGKFTKPRSELLRVSADFLKAALQKRWYPTEQTIYLILQCFWNNRWTATSLQFATLGDNVEAKNNPNVVQQIERMELWLKYIWRDKNRGWDSRDYFALCRESFDRALTGCSRLLNELKA